LVALPGASRYFQEGVTLYADAAKVRVCGVSEQDLSEHGAVSEPVARAMAEGIRAAAGTDWGIGMTGITGPAGGRPGKPIGTVHLAIAGPHGTAHHRHTHHGGRAQIIQRSVTTALARFLQGLRERS